MREDIRRLLDGIYKGARDLPFHRFGNKSPECASNSPTLKRRFVITALTLPSPSTLSKRRAPNHHTCRLLKLTCGERSAIKP